MLPRTKAAALSLIMLTSAFAFLGLVLTDDGPMPLKAGIADAWYTVNLNVTVTDEVGRPIDGAVVWITDNTSSPWTTVNGNVLIEGLADNVTSYTLWANKSGYLNSLETVVDVVANATTNATLVVTGASLWGFVTSPLGLVQDASVYISSSPAYSSNVSLVDGTYMIQGIPSGTYLFVAAAPGYDLANSTLTIAAGRIYRQDFTLYSQRGVIAGFVFHATTHAPLNETNISVTVGNSTITVTNSADGSYIIPEPPDGLPEGTYTLTATKDGFYPESLSEIVVVRGNRTENVNFTLIEKPTAIYGTVKSGAYLQPNVNVSVVGTTYYNISNVEGHYSIENLTAGVYSVSAQLEGYALAIIQNVVVPVGGQIEVDIELVALPGAIVRGEVLEKNTGNPLIYVAVTIIGPDGKQKIKETNFKGQFEFTGLADGNYTLQFEAKGYRPLEVSRIEVKSDAVSNDTYYLMPERTSFSGFIFGFDLAHSMMILALFVTIMMLAAAVYLRIRTFQAPENAPAVYDQAEELQEEEEKEGESSERPKGVEKKERKTRKTKGSGG
jgi:hypothetical protein